MANSKKLLEYFGVLNYMVRKSRKLAKEKGILALPDPKCGKKQKRHIICNLKELYVPFKNTNPEVKIGLSKLCTLRAKYCFLDGASGTHSVCVCTIHQNVKLLLQPIDATNKELLSLWFVTLKINIV